MTKEEAFDCINHIMYSSPHESTEQIVKKKYYAELLKDYIADSEPVRHGRWIDSPLNVECSICGWYGHRNNDDYCSHCGAKMDEECDEVNDEEYDDYYTRQTMIEVKK